MKKHVILVLALLLTMVFGMSTLTTSTAHAATDSSLTKLQKKGTLVMGTSPDYPPYEFQATVHGKTKIVGMDVAVGEKIAKDLGVKLVVKSMSFDSLLVALQTGKVDMVISGMNPTAARKKSVDFTHTYYQGGYSIVINKNDRGIYKNKDSFVGKTIGAQTGSTMYNESKKQTSGTTVKGMTSVSDLILALQSHKIQGVAMEKPSAQAYVANNKELAAIPSDFNLNASDTSAAVAFKKGSSALVHAANKSVDQIKTQNLVNKTYLPAAGKYLKTNTVNTSMWHYWKAFLTGVEYTLIITVCSVFFGFILGVLLALARMGQGGVFRTGLRWLATAYVEFIRGTPMMVQVMFVYFGLGLIVNLPALTSGIIAISLNSGAYVAEYIRGGINSVDAGQTEAARSLGMSSGATMRYVILPQALKNIWPSLGNEFITLIKDSSIVSIIGVSELIFQSNIVRSDTYRGVAPIAVIMVLYFILTFTASRILNYFERRMQHD
ncbi:ABC transporter permease subunit [Levilactobacillus brevis]|jgi:His/Glu/Gln/Arg/opine family amino acid ABC transporter permease subunit|uniref:ABC-type amino acid transport system, permease and periplasmic component n=1 Tax=Levilactobacillus brevis (strain ATCC 367 / BCRC 12310 / CIP 105137 / JCM 1170 / LMG 11437 / NCIMB 947 / NCTC 947) TaxID=387344 RepID=Q03R66_LEVBA|nr:ABC transporter substrate-binding protein/permease [Levilactobacillus brevis]MBL3537600.1 ABC transporter substrate-binding protein/permease [Lactobacillus sp. GPR40-2]MBL3630758.1 ABC transporter substrate-binding protein/permease [Lactobacillus sp. GPB7-4]ABJ64306.1 ABC-type amino acid transport system, permease and periplasmic component [Levilactobacillus brevis ATCC 367]ARW21787.1 putative ABC transporter extracellular-binding protein YckB [Levilactobacillus brevis]KLE29769.1 ABC transp